MFPTLLTAGLQPWGVSQIFLFTFEGFSHYVNISTPAIFTAKINALLAHRTQYPDAAALTAGVKELGARGAALAGAVRERVQYAELFYRICIYSDCAISGNGVARRRGLFV